MDINTLLNDPEFIRKKNNNEISPYLIEDMKNGCIPPDKVYEAIHSTTKDTFYEKLLCGR